MKTAKNIILLALLLLLSSNTMAGALYAVKTTDTDLLLVRIDPESLEVEEVGSFPLQSFMPQGGMAWDPVSQTLYLLLDQWFADSELTILTLYTVDTQTAATTLIGPTNYLHVTGLDYDCANGELLALNNYDSFYNIDTSSAYGRRIPHLEEQWPLGFTGLAYNQFEDILVGLDGLDRVNPVDSDLYLLDWRTGGGYSILFSNPQQGRYLSSLAYDPDRDLYWTVNRYGELYSFDVSNDFQYTRRETGLGDLKHLVYVHDKPCEPRPLPINYGLTDAWFNPTTAGQGFLVTVFPEIKQLFLAWFTYDTERPPEDVTAILGEPGHRWLTAQGPYEGDTANLIIYVTEGAAFDTSEPAASTDPAGDGTMTIIFDDCNSGSISYDIPSIGRQGEITIERIALDKVPLCEQLEQLAQ